MLIVYFSAFVLLYHLLCFRRQRNNKFPKTRRIGSDYFSKEKTAMNNEISKLEDLSAEAMVRTLSESISHYPPLIAQEIPEVPPGLFKQIVNKLSRIDGISFLLTMKQEDHLEWALYLPRDREFHFDQFKDKCLSLIHGHGRGQGPLWQGDGEVLDHTEDFKKAFLKMEGF